MFFINHIESLTQNAIYMNTNVVHYELNIQKQLFAFFDPLLKRKH